MRHYGGIYLDLDNVSPLLPFLPWALPSPSSDHCSSVYFQGCARSLDPLLSYPAFVVDGGHGTLSNNIIGARPDHPFFVLMTDSLVPWAVNYMLPYFTVHYASGQWFLTAIWERYHGAMAARADAGVSVPDDDRIYRIMTDMRPGSDPWVFFTQGRGGSWDSWDNQVFSFFGNVLVPFLGHHAVAIVLGSVILVATWASRKRWMPRRKRKGDGYLPLREPSSERES